MPCFAGSCCYAKRLAGLVANEFMAQGRNFVLWVPIFQSAGILLYFSLNHEPNLTLVISLAGLAPVLIFVATKSGMLWLLCLTFGILGFVGAYYRTTSLLPAEKPAVMRRRMYVENVVGVLKEIDYRPGYIRLLVCDIKGKRAAPQAVCARLAARTAVDSEIRVGDSLSFSGLLYPPRVAASEHGYDDARDSYFKGIQATGYTTSEVRLHQRSENVSLKEGIEGIRHKVYRALTTGLKRDCAEVMAALLIGKRLGIREEILSDVRNAGLAHLFAISGLHLSFIAWISFFLVRNILVFSETMALSCNIKKLAAVAAMIASVGYLLVSGMPVSACRAFIMVALTFMGIIVDRQHNSLRSIAAAATCILLFTPEVVLQPGFQMSFMAVIALVTSCDFNRMITANRVVRYLGSSVASSFIASVATAP
ncbi:MAG: ComEC/Rec2 family competence protein, partial [Anaplasma sp.]